MRPSELKTPLARMRNEINTPKLQLVQKTIADWIGVNESHYRKIECGIKPLTRKHADAISRKTRVHPDSLLAKGKNKLLNVYLKDWTPKDFLQCRKDRGRWEKIVAQAEFAKIVALLADVLLYARQAGEPKFYDTTQKIKTTLQRIYCDLDETGIHKMEILGSIFSCRHSETRVDLKPISDALEKGFTKLKSRGKL